jgi:hypothetical protein
MKRADPFKDAVDWDAKAIEALEAARLMPRRGRRRARP